MSSGDRRRGAAFESTKGASSMCAAMAEGAHGLLWPPERFPEAVREVILRSDLPTVGAGVTQLTVTEDPREVIRWVRHAAGGMGVEGRTENTDLADLSRTLDEAGPYLLVCHPTRTSLCRGIALVRGPGEECVVVLPDGSERTMDCTAVCAALRDMVPEDRSLEDLFGRLPGGDSAFARLMERERLGSSEWTVVRFEVDPAQSFAIQLRHAGVTRRFAAYLV